MTVKIGAYRVNNFCGAGTTIGDCTNFSLGNSAYRDRIPWYGALAGEPLQYPHGMAKINANSQAFMDRDIWLAAQYGVPDYFVFDFYPPDPRLGLGGTFTPWTGLNDSLTLYRTSTSPHKSTVKYSLLLIDDQYSMTTNPPGTSGWSTIAGFIANCMRDTSWQTIEGGRPILYVYNSSGAGATTWGSPSAFGAALGQITTAARGYGLQDPYFVGCRNTSTDFVAAGFHAISQYSTPQYPTWPTPASEISYASLIAPVESLWASQVGTGYPVIPNCMTGWDDRAFDNWMCTAVSLGPYPATSVAPTAKWSTKGTNVAVANHIKAGVDWCAANSAHTPTEQHVVVYAWDESLECGNGLTPTLLDPAGSLLQQVSTTLGRYPTYTQLYG